MRRRWTPPPPHSLLNPKVAWWTAALNLLAARIQKLEVTAGVKHAPGGAGSSPDCCVEERNQCLCTTAETS